MRAMLPHGACVVLAACLAASAGAQRTLTDEQMERLVEALRHSPVMKARLQAALILGNAGDERAMQGLLACTSPLERDPDYPVRGACALALGKLGDLRGVEPLTRLLDDPEIFVREEALRSLKLLARAEAAPYLRAAREQLTPRARLALVEVSQAMPEPSSADALLSDLLAEDAPAVRTAVDNALAGLAPKRLAALLTASLEHSNYRVRGRAAALLAEYGIADIQRLGAALANPAELPEVHAAVWQALRRLSHAIDGGALASVARDSSREKHERARALMLLSAKGGNTALDTCLSALDDQDEYLRGVAATALADLGDARAVERLKLAAATAENGRLARIIQGSIRRLERR